VLRAYEVEIREAHRLHRARGGADIARMAGFAQHDANIRERIDVTHAVE
jgi:hypothetical protein